MRFEMLDGFEIRLYDGGDLLGIAFFASAPLGDRISASLDDRIETHPYPSRGGDKVEGMDVGGDLLGVAFFYL